MPASAPLITGKRAVVYVADPVRAGVYEGREVVLGPRAGDFYMVSEGLVEGELVVVQGNFKIDSALQILARPSMMNPGGGGPAPGHDLGGHGEVARAARAGAPAEREAAEPVATPARFREQLGGVYDAYFAVHEALSHDSNADAQRAAERFAGALDGVDMSLLDHEAHLAWMPLLGELRETSAALAAAGDIAAARAAFEGLSAAVTHTARVFGKGGTKPLLVYHCPMAFGNKGADWLQREKGTANPYFGSTMFKCGSVTAELPADPMAAAEMEERDE